MFTLTISKRRALVVAGIMVVLLVAAGVLWWVRRSDTATAATLTTTETVTAQSFKQSVSATGTIAPASQADVSFSVSGTVTAVKVAAGDAVQAGDVLATVDNTVLKSAVTAKQSALTAAQSKLSEDNDASASSAQIASDKASVAQAQNDVASAEADLANASLKATISGTVASVNIADGDVVGGSGGAGGGGSSSAAAFTIVSPKAFIVNAKVSTSQITGVTAGLQAQITVTGVNGTAYGTVASVGKVATAQSNGAATFPVVISVTGDRDDLYAGTTATVSIIVKQVDNVLAVSAQALHSDGGETYVYKMVDGKAVKTAVTVGATYGRYTEITKGLSAGDVVQVTTLQLPAGGSDRTRSTTGPQGGFPNGGGFQDGGGFPNGGAFPGGGQQ